MKSPEQKFFEEWAKDPDFLNKLKKTTSLNEFKSKYNLERSTPLKCPICSSGGMATGSLWISKKDLEGNSYFVCRKCKMIYYITTQPTPIEDIIEEIRQAQKEKY